MQAISNDSPIAIADLPSSPHAAAAARILEQLAVKPASGLADETIELRRQRYGANTLRAKATVPLTRILLNQLKSPIVLLLAMAAAIAALFGEWHDTVAIAVVLLINTALGFITEMRAVRSMEALRQLGTRTTRVRRSGQVMAVAAEDLVPGDIVLLEGGDVVTADLRLIDCTDLFCDESTLTGESAAVAKSVANVPADTIVAERSCLVFKGTAIVRGSAVGVVVATGMATELGRISKLVEDADDERSPLEEHLDRLGGQLIRVTLVLTGLIASIGVLSGKDLVLMVQSAIALAVAAIPEGLPIVATMALARGMLRMARHNALVNRLAAVETLGAATVIFTDKTGTLTENRMRVAQLWLAGEDAAIPFPIAETRQEGAGSHAVYKRALEIMTLCNNATLDRDEARSTGDPMEVALLAAAREGGVDRKQLDSAWPRTAERPFDSDTKIMATLHQSSAGWMLASKGAPEELLRRCAFFWADDSEREFTDRERQRWLERTAALAEQGLRILALACRASDTELEVAPEQLTFVGLLGLHDPPRKDVSAAVEACRQAGVKIIMVTGDHAVTARSIGRSIGLAGPDTAAMEGRNLGSLEKLPLTERAKLRDCRIFARVSPEQKLDLIALHQSAGAVVAMTGDGVNDAPALKKANIGVAMGLRGTEVAREAADMILLDDAFPTIVAAIREGRIIFSNIRRFAIYLLSCNISEVLIVAIAVLFGLPLPLLPLQILFLNLVTDVFPAFALAAGEGDADTLRQPPRQPDEKILEPRHWKRIVWFGFAITAASLGALLFARYGLGTSDEKLVAVSFLTLAFAQLLHVFNMRDRNDNLLINDVTLNPFVWAALALCIGIILAVVYLPWLADLLKIAPPTAAEWLLIAIASALPVLVTQFVWIARDDIGKAS